MKPLQKSTVNGQGFPLTFTVIALVTVLTHAFIALKSLNACTSMFTRVRGAKGSV